LNWRGRFYELPLPKGGGFLLPRPDSIPNPPTTEVSANETVSAFIPNLKDGDFG
jgi:hypothetical protein